MKHTLIAATMLLILAPLLHAADWPTYNHDNRRSAATDEPVDLPLAGVWRFESPMPPQPAWPDPAKNDYFHKLYNLRSTVAFDRAFALVGVGRRLYFGSNADNKLYCLDADSGAVVWTFFTNAPIRLAPAVVAGRVYAASDDGYLYALDAHSGRLLWKYTADENARLIPGNGRLISSLPIRCGLVVDGDTLYLGAGLFPTQGAFLVALDAASGQVKQKQPVAVSPQGYMLASDNALYVPTGRTAPVMFTRDRLDARGEFKSPGGAYAILIDDVLVTGPGRGKKEIAVGDAATRDTIATFGGLRMVVAGSVAYMQSEASISAFDRSRYLELSRRRNPLAEQIDQLNKQIKAKPDDPALKTQLDTASRTVAQIDAERKACYLWTVDCNAAMSLILAGDTLFAGGDGLVLALDTRTGRTVCEMPVKGKAHHLAAFNRSLFVSTDTGGIYRFAGSDRVDGVSRGEGVSPLRSTGILPVHKKPVAEGDSTESPFARSYSQAAEAIVRQTGMTQGYCIVLDSQQGRLALELARRTNLRIIAVESDPAAVDPARRALDSAGLHGRVIALPGPLERLNFTSFIANLVVSDAALTTGRLPDDPRRIARLIRPEGGVLCIGRPVSTAAGSLALPHARDTNVTADANDIDRWLAHFPDDCFTRQTTDHWTILTRKPLPGAGQWTHQHADPAGTACSGDGLTSPPLAVQWFGQPGPAEMADRHHRNVAPLYHRGRLFVPGDTVIYAMDAYNGTVLYDVRVPDSRRLGVFLDSGNIAVDPTALYVAAGDRCLRFDPATGRPLSPLNLPATDEPRHWGYLACTDEAVYGSTCKPDAAYTEISYDADMALWYRGMKLVTSDRLFALDKADGRVRWTYAQGVILNTTIILDADRVYFIETTNPRAMSGPTGRLPVKALFESGRQYLTALDRRTGETVYRRPIDTTNLEEPVYLNYADATVLLSGSKLDAKVVRYYYYAFDARTGEPRWSADHDSELPTDGAHGEYNRRPTIVAATAYAWPYAYNIATGEKDPAWKFQRLGHGCGGISASANALFWRGLNPWMYDLTPGGGPVRINTVTRPGCWINIIPAGGMVLIPEASSGCTCGFSLQTSLAYIPQSLLNPSLLPAETDGRRTIDDGHANRPSSIVLRPSSLGAGGPCVLGGEY